MKSLTECQKWLKKEIKQLEYFKHLTQKVGLKFLDQDELDYLTDIRTHLAEADLRGRGK